MNQIFLLFSARFMVLHKSNCFYGAFFYFHNGRHRLLFYVKVKGQVDIIKRSPFPHHLTASIRPWEKRFFLQRTWTLPPTSGLRNTTTSTVVYYRLEMIKFKIFFSFRKNFCREPIIILHEIVVLFSFSTKINDNKSVNSSMNLHSVLRSYSYYTAAWNMNKKIEFDI